MSGELHSLSQLLYTLKRTLPAGTLLADTNAVWVSLDRLIVDYRELQEAFSQKDYDRVIAIYRGGFLTNVPYISENFEEWREERAATAEATVIEAYRILVQQKIADEDLLAVPDLCNRALQIARHDPFFIRAQIETLAAQNNIGAALASYALHRRLLIRETGSAPAWMNEEFTARISRLPELDVRPDDPDVGAPFVGRLPVITELREGWRRAHDRVRAIRLIGEPGVGKTRVLSYFVRRTVLDGSRVHLYSCAEADAVVPYAAVVGLLVSNWKNDSLQRLPTRLRHAIASVAPEIGGDDIPSSTMPQRVVFEGLAQYFVECARHERLVLAIDDFQWADDVSRAAVSYIARRLDQSGGLLLLASRTGGGHTVCDDIVKDVIVERMSEPEIEQLIDQSEAATGFPYSATCRKAVYSKSAGNPFLALQLLRVVRENPEGEAAMQASGSLPTNISRVLGSRIDALSDTARQVAATLAVLNRPSAIPSVAEITGIAEVRVAAAVDEMVRRGIVQNGLNCEFVHDLMRRAVYEAVSTPLRTVLHQRTANSLRYLGGSAGELAFHFERGGALSDAWECARRAAAETIRLSGYREADIQYQRMLRCTSAERRAQTAGEYVSFLCRAGRTLEASDHLDAAEQHAVSNADEDLQLICKLIRFEREMIHSPVDVQSVLLRANELIDNAQARVPDLLPEFIRMTAHIVTCLGVPDLLRPFGKMLMQDKAGSSGAQRNATASIIVAMTDGYSEALPIADRAMTLAEASHDAMAHAAALFARATVRVYAGMCAGARSDYERLLELSDELGSLGRRWAAKVNLIVVMMDQGLWHDAERAARAVLSAAPPEHHAFLHGNLAVTLYRNGDYQRCRDVVDSLERSHARELNTWVPVQALALRGLCDIAEGRLDTAERCWRDLMELTPAETFPIDLSTVHELGGRLIAATQSPKAGAEYLLGKGDSVGRLDYLAGARLAVLGAELLAPEGTDRVHEILGQILERTTLHEAFAVRAEAARVLAQYDFSTPAPPPRI